MSGPKRLILVRHGEPEFGLPRWCSMEHFHSWEESESERPLSAKGRAQADDLARRLVGYRPTQIIVSPLLRTRQTAAPLAKACRLEPVYWPDLREARFGRFFSREGRWAAWASRNLLFPAAAWPVILRIVWLFFRTHHAPSRHSVAERCDKVLVELRRICAADETVVLVGHGMVTAFLGAALTGSGNSTAAMVRFMLKTGEYRILERERDAYRQVRAGRGGAKIE